MKNLRVIYAIIRQTLKQNNSKSSQIISIAIGVVFAAVYAWIARQSGNSTVSTYVLIGIPLMAISGRLIFRVGWALTVEANSGTLEFSLISQTPMITVFIGKTLAQMVSSSVNASVSFITVLIMTGGVFLVNNIGLLPFSLLLAIIGLFVIGLFFAPFMTLSKGRGGFFQALVPFVSLISGFLFPIDRLPSAFQVIARLLPTSWAMDAVWKSIQGNTSFGQVAISWAMSGVLSVLWFMLTYYMFKMVEKRIRVTGTLGTY